MGSNIVRRVFQIVDVFIVIYILYIVYIYRQRERIYDSGTENLGTEEVVRCSEVRAKERVRRTELKRVC